MIGSDPRFELNSIGWIRIGSDPRLELNSIGWIRIGFDNRSEGYEENSGKDPEISDLECLAFTCRAFNIQSS